MFGTSLAFRSSGGGVPIEQVGTRTTYAGTTGASTHTFSHTVDATTDFLIVKVTFEGSNAVDEVRWGGAGGTLLTKDAGSDRALTDRKTNIWYLAAPTVQTADVYIAIGVTENVGAEAVNLKNVDQSSPIADSDSGAISSGTSVTLDSALVPDGTGWIETCCCFAADTLTGTSDGGPAETADFDAGDHRSLHSNQADVTGNVTPGWTASSSTLLVMSAVMLRAA